MKITQGRTIVFDENILKNGVDEFQFKNKNSWALHIIRSQDTLNWDKDRENKQENNRLID